MSHGFLGYDSSFMLDVVVCALVLVVPILGYSISVVKFQRDYVLHRNLQVILGVLLFATVAAFEIDLQIVHKGWLNVANKNPEAPRLVGDRLAIARTALRVHLVFAVTTPFLWAATMCLAFRRYPKPPVPGRHSKTHKLFGWLSVADLVMTSVTGLAFYYFAFVAK